MAQSKLLRRCNDFVEAESIRTRLDAAGILSVVNGADAHIILSYIGTALGGVKLEVAPEDYDRAVELLEQDERNAALAGPWICEACSEQNEATFEVCWNCQKPRDENDQLGRLNESPDEASLGQPTVEPETKATVPDAQARNPYRPVLLTPAGTEESIRDDLDNLIENDVHRAFAAAIFGIVLLPPLLNLYSLVLLVHSEARLGFRIRKHRVRLLLAWSINLIAVVVWPILILRFWFS